MFTAKLYNKTGFNLVNIPDTPALLETAASSTKTVATMDILQLYFNPVIAIKAFEKDVMYADYLELIGDFDGTSKSAYYFIENYKMTSGDTVELNVSMEPWLTAGGLSKVQFLDGITNRHHVGYSEDVFGAFQEDDDIFVPSQPVEIVEEDRLFDPTKTAAYKTGSGYALVVLSGTDLNNAENYRYDVWESSDESDGKKGSMNFGGTFAEWMGGDRYNPETLLSTHRSFTGNPFVVTCALDDTAVNNIMAKLCNIYANGAGSVVNYMYLIPLQYATYLQNGVNNRMQNTVDFADISFKLPDARKGTGGVKNIRVYGGPENSEIFLSTASGAVKEIRIDHLALNEEEKPGDVIEYTTSVGAFADVRPGGGITYTFSEKTTPTSFMEGGKWMEMPSSVTSSDGINQARAQFEANRTLSNMEYGADAITDLNHGANKLIPYTGFHLLPHKYLTEGFKSAYGGIENRALANRYGVTQDGQAAYDLMDLNTASLLQGIKAGDEKSRTAYSRQMQLQNEMKQFNASVVLNGHVTGDIKSIPDTSCHEVIHYSKRLSGPDRAKFDTILTRYGYRHTQVLKNGGSTSTDILRNRQHYNYIQTKGVSVSCDTVPKSVRDSICDAFNTGVRIWHVKPSMANLITNPYAGGN